MGLTSDMDWWDEWKLRILVLCSVFVQFFLSFAKYVRTWYVLRRLRVLVWLAYIGGDALAVYALATLFNRQKQQTTADGGGGGSALEVIWAPVLLIHLGGGSISAYSLEDNELWKRHAITLVSQVTVALYVFCKWWSGDKKLLQAAVLLFVVGILRFSEKPWALRRASFRTVANTNLSLQPRDQGSIQPRDQGSSDSAAASGLWSAICTLICTCTDLLSVTLSLLHKQLWGEKAMALEEFVMGAWTSVMIVAAEPEASVEAQQKELEKNNTILYRRHIYNMFLDLPAQYSFRLYLLKSFLKLGDEYQHRMLKEWILFQFRATYTKVRLTATCLGLCLLCLLPSLALASVILFVKSDKDGYNKSDITVTYILFFAAAVMEIKPLCMFFSFSCLPFIFRRCHRRNKRTNNNLLQGMAYYQWQDMVSQHNIMLFCSRKKKPPTLMKLAAFSYLLKDYINKHWYIRYEPAAQQISVLVRKHIQDGWKEYICYPSWPATCVQGLDVIAKKWPATYRMFSNCRGDLTLRKHHLLEQLGWSLDLPFDDCVILWHVATDLCIRNTTNTKEAAASSSSHQDDANIKMMSETISNYMIYLLFICPEMLMPGTRQDLFTLACDDIELVIKKKPLDGTASSTAQQILDMAEESDEEEGDEEEGDENLMEAPRIFNACELAKALIGINDQAKMWEVIQGVWVEMICYSASRCRGYMHAMSLAHGGEFLTNVWLLWSCMGMETLPDMMQNPVQPTPAAAAAWV